MARKRARWMSRRGRIDPRRLVFLDETWVKTNMAPLRGWGPKGRRLNGYAPHGRWKTLTFIAALRHDRIEAPFVIDGPINGAFFQAYVEQILAPTLSPGDVVILDNLGSHKGKARQGRRQGQRRPSDLPAALQPGPEPHRTGLLQAQASDAQSPAQNPRGHMAKSRPAPRPLQPGRMRQLPHKLRIWFRIMESRSRRALWRSGLAAGLPGCVQAGARRILNRRSTFQRW